MNHRVATLKLRGALLTACGGIVASCVFACGGDDTSTPPGDDSGAETSTVVESGTDAKADSTTPGLDAAPDVAADVSVDVKLDAVVDAQPDVRVDVSVDAPIEATLDAGSDGGDATADADAGSAPLVPLDICPTLDTDYGITNTGDRALTWGVDISSSGGDSFALALTNDCRVNGISSAISGNGANGLTAYLDQLTAFSLQFFGCPEVDGGALSFSGLIPAGAANHVFTAADLTVISQLYADSTVAQASINWAANLPPTPEPLTVDQINDIQAQLAGLAAVYPGVNPNTTRYTYSTCDAGAGDAGGEAGGDASTDAGAEAGADAGTD